MRVKSTGNYRREEVPPPIQSPVRLNFKNHCLFCLQPQQPATILDVVQKNPQNLKSFQPILHYLTGTDPTFDKSKGECERMGIPAMDNLPPMCLPCYGTMGELYSLHVKLLSLQILIQKQTELARQTVPLRLQSLSRQQFYERIGSSGLSGEEVSAVRKFVEELHNKIIGEVSDKKKVIFPARPPPDFNPEHGPTLASAKFSVEPSGSSDDSTMKAADRLDPFGTSSEPTSKLNSPSSVNQSININPSCSTQGSSEVVILIPPVVEDDVKYENEAADDDYDGELHEPQMIIPDVDIAIPEERSSRYRSDPLEDDDDFDLASNASSSASSEYRPIRSRTRSKVSSGLRTRKGLRRTRNEDASLSTSGKVTRTRARDIRRVVNGKSTYVAQYCDLCSERVPISEITNHLETIHNVKDFVACCPSPVCPFVFSCRGKMERHLTSQNPRKCTKAANLPPGRLFRICETCGFETRSGRAFRNHIQQKHEFHMTEKSLPCPVPGCSERYALRQSVEDHINFHDLRRHPNNFQKSQKSSSACKHPIKQEDSANHLEGSHERDDEIIPSEPTTLKPSTSLSPTPSMSTPTASSSRVSSRLMNTKRKIVKRKPRPLPTPAKLRKIWEEEEIPGGATKTRMRNIRMAVNGKSTYVAQYCDLCGERFPLSEILHHLENTHNLKDFVTRCLSSSCPFYFSCRKKMEQHITSQHPQRCGKVAKLPRGPLNKTCETCGFETKSGRQFRNHVQQKHEFNMTEKTLHCPIPDCNERYALRQALDDHINYHDLRPQSPDQECSVCKEQIKIQDIAEHLKEAHQIKEVVPCKRCPHIFPDWESLLDHVPVHQLCYGLSCDLCDDGKQFIRTDNLRQHYFNVHKIGKQFICEYCDRSFVNPNMLMFHKQKRHQNETDKADHDQPPPPKKEIVEKSEKGKVKCDQCPEPIFFSCQTSLRTHNIKFHLGDPFTCRYCSKPFFTMHSLTRHESEHTGRRREYKCSYEGCGRTFQNHTLLRYHEEGRHSGTQNFICETCGKKFNYRKAMKAHVDRMHLGKQGHLCVCETCGKTICKKSLKIHMLIHSGARPHSCNICHKTFRHKEAMLTHVRAHQERGESFKPKNRTPT